MEYQLCPTKPRPVDLLVISDIHYGRLAVSEEFGTREAGPKADEKMLTGIISTVETSSCKPNAILVAGDLSSHAKPSEFEGCLRVVNKIALGLNIKPNRIFHTFGNHDVDWQICELGKAKEAQSPEPLYDSIAASVGSLVWKTNELVKPGPLPGTGVFNDEDFSLFILNSSFFSTSNQKCQHGKLGAEQIEWLKGELHLPTPTSKWRLVLMHHHPFNYAYPSPAFDPSLLEEGAELVDLLGAQGVDMLIHGHRHHPYLATHLRSEWKRPITFFCSGSLAVNPDHRESGRIPNLFHLIRLQERLESHEAFGSVTSFEYSSGDGWRKIRNSSETPLDHEQCFGVVATGMERKHAAKDYLSGIITQNKAAMFIPLGTQDAIPSKIRCCSQEQLHQLLCLQAKALGYRILGRGAEAALVSDNATPFHNSQARDLQKDTLVKDFCPISHYFSLFNNQHEIIVGARGCGKTTILRMLSYSHFSRLKTSQTQSIGIRHRFIGFYIPIRLELVTASTEFFQFAFNCQATTRFLDELKTILLDMCVEPKERLATEASLTRKLSKAWLRKNESDLSCLDDLAIEIIRIYQQRPVITAETPFAKGLFAPIEQVLPEVCKDLAIDANNTYWLACVDEAEFLKPAQFRCFISFMQEPKAQIVLKLSTLPFGTAGFVEAKTTYKIRPIDLNWDSYDFEKLTEQIVYHRFAKLYNNDSNLPPMDLSTLMAKIWFNPQSGLEGAPRGYPVSAKERMDTGFPWFAGASLPLVRRLADGNPRRFIELMRSLFNEASTPLTLRQQHRAITEFANREFESIAGIPDQGMPLQDFIYLISKAIRERQQGKKTRMPTGTRFSIARALLETNNLRQTLETGVAYRKLMIDHESLLNGITESTTFRLAHFIAVRYGLPMVDDAGFTLPQKPILFSKLG